tara:strand:- start:259 stop:540 length:282 start_codon:yes stop_codon:yes gene_type:complete
MKLINNSRNQPCHEVDGELIVLSLEVMDIVSPNPFNSEFYGSEQEIANGLKNILDTVIDRDNNIDADEMRFSRIKGLLSAIAYSKKFTAAHGE